METDGLCLMYNKGLESSSLDALNLNVVELESDDSDLGELEDDVTATLDTVIGMLDGVKQVVETRSKKNPKYDKEKLYLIAQEQLKQTRRKLLASARENRAATKEKEKFKMECKRLKKELKKKDDAINAIVQSPRKKSKRS